MIHPASQEFSDLPSLVPTGHKMVQFLLLRRLLFSLALTGVFVLTLDAPFLLAKMLFKPRSLGGFSGFDKSDHEILEALFDGSFFVVPPCSLGAMTRAKQTLTLFQRADESNPYCGFLENSLASNQLLALSPQIERPIPENILNRRYDIVGMKDIYLDYAGRIPNSSSIHSHLARTSVGDSVQLKKTDDSKLEVCNSAGRTIVTLSKEATQKWVDALSQVENVKVLAMIERRVDDSKDQRFQKLFKADKWEVPVLDVVYLSNGNLNETDE